MPPTQSAASPSFVRHAAFILGLTFCRTSLAQPAESGSSEIEPSEYDSAPVSEPRSGETSETTDAPPRIVPPRVQINSVGSALPASSLERLLGPALKSSFDLRFERAQHFQPTDLFDVRTTSPSQIHVWVDTTAKGVTRVYFANRDGTRYLVRDLTHAEPMNEMDREAIAQTIEWSLGALAEGTAGMTREEAEALLSEPEREESEAPEPTPPPKGPPPSWRRVTRGWLPEVALLHTWTPQAKEMAGTLGPALRVGIDHLSARHQFGVATSAHYFYPRRHAERGVAIELETVGARFGVRYLALGLVRGSGVGLRLGGGIDVVTSSPQALDLYRFEASEPSQNVVPLFDVGLVWQVQVEKSVRLEASLGLEVDFVEVNYDLLTAEGTQTLLSRWPARPSLSVGLALF